MKKALSILLALMLMLPVLPAFADTEYLPNGITTTNNVAFAYSKYLQTIVFPSSYTTILALKFHF